MTKNNYYCDGVEIDSACIQKRNWEKIVIEENRSRLVFENPLKKKTFVIKVDGCAINDSRTKKCDYLVVYPRKNNFDEHFIELKGNYGISKAIKQLENSIKKLGCKIFDKRFAYIITSNSMPKITTRVQGEMIRFMKRFKASLLTKVSGKFVQNLEEPKSS